MEPTRDRNATLVDLLDRALDKGLVIHADVIISLAGIPLIGVNLRAAIAGMETMLEYGIMRDWDEATRAWERTHWKDKEPVLIDGEEVGLRVFGTQYYSEGIYTAWRGGYIHLTNKRLFSFRKEPPELLFETPLEKIKALEIKGKRYMRGERKELYVLLDMGEVLMLHTKDVEELKKAIEERMSAMGLSMEENLIFPELSEQGVDFLADGEEITHRGRMWHYLHDKGGNIWKPGYLYLTNERLCWCYDGGITFETPIDGILGAAIRMKKFDGMLNKKRVLMLLYKNSDGPALFSGDRKLMARWDKVFNTIHKAEGDTETCPGCGKIAPVAQLLSDGCTCGWISPRVKRPMAIADQIK